jgi:hypothetical protein
MTPDSSEVGNVSTEANQRTRCQSPTCVPCVSDWNQR